MERRHIKWLPLLLTGLFFAYQYFSSEKFVNPETGRKSHVAMSTREESITWTSKLSAGPGTVGECRFWTGVGAGETSGIAAGYRRRQSRYGLRLAGLVDSLLAGKRLLFAGW